MTMPIWEVIDKSCTDSTQRMKVPGGWLVCRVNGSHSPQSMVGWFVPDKDYTWVAHDEKLPD